MYFQPPYGASGAYPPKQGMYNPAFEKDACGLAILIVQSRRHPGLEPSPYQPGRGRKDLDADVESQNNPSDFVDVSEPPSEEVAAGASATSTAPTDTEGAR